jgi:hypothetical protein
VLKALGRLSETAQLALHPTKHLDEECAEKRQCYPEKLRSRYQKRNHYNGRNRKINGVLAAKVSHLFHIVKIFNLLEIFGKSKT